MMKITYLDPKKKHSIKCDVATKQANLMPLFLQYSIKDKKTGITHAGVELLLADKIRTFAERGHKKLAKGVSDLSDVRFCVTNMFLHDRKMDKELKSLYTQRDLDTVLEALKVFTDKRTDWESWSEMAEEIDLTID